MFCRNGEVFEGSRLTYADEGDDDDDDEWLLKLWYWCWCWW